MSRGGSCGAVRLRWWDDLHVRGSRIVLFCRHSQWLRHHLVLLVRNHAERASCPRPATSLTAATAATIRMISTSAPAHACRCHSSKGEIAYVKICKGNAAIG